MKHPHDYRDSRIDTQAIHAGRRPDPAFGSVGTPIYQTSTFAFESCAQGAARFSGAEPGYVYTRMGNPTVAALEEAVCTLEGGYAALATASGMAATCTVAFTFLGQARHMIGTDAVYGPTRVVFEQTFSRFGASAASWTRPTSTRCAPPSGRTRGCCSSRPRPTPR